MSTHKPDYRELEKENKALKKRLSQIEESNIVKKKAASWLRKKVFVFFIGHGLKGAIKQGVDEYNKTNKVSSENISNVGAHLIWRLTRIGVFGAVVALLPTLLMALQTYYLNIQNEKIDNQNKMFSTQNKMFENQNSLVQNQNDLILKQNKRLDQQTHLQEAGRRSSLVFLFANVMDAVDTEIKNKHIKENRRLSKQLIGRIVALSKSLKPYKYLSSDSLTTSFVSPERSQLLTYLINANLANTTYSQIFNSGEFTNLELSNVTIKDIKFENLDLSGSILNNVKFNNCQIQSFVLNNIKSENISFNHCVFDVIYMEASFVNVLNFISCIIIDELIADGNFLYRINFRYSYSKTLNLHINLVKSLTFQDSFTQNFNFSKRRRHGLIYGPKKNTHINHKEEIKKYKTKSISWSFYNSHFIDIKISEWALRDIKPKGFSFYRFKYIGNRKRVFNFFTENGFELKYDEDYKIYTNQKISPQSILDDIENHFTKRIKKHQIKKRYINILKMTRKSINEIIRAQQQNLFYPYI